MKLCKGCGETKPLSEFHQHHKYGTQYRCKKCQVTRVTAYYKANPEKHARYNREWGRKNPDAKADIALKTRLGIAHGTYATMLAAQDGLCAICGTDQPSPTGSYRRFHVDHDELTGAIRGLLCGRCNTGIGQFLHDTERLHRAVDYLNKYQPKVPEFDTEDSILQPNC